MPNLQKPQRIHSRKVYATHLQGLPAAVVVDGEQ